MSQKAKLPRSIKEEDFESILDASWEQFALFAFEKYQENGRGVPFLERHGLNDDILHDQVDLGYAVYEPGRPDPDAARMIEQYDPAWEIVLSVPATGRQGQNRQDQNRPRQPAPVAHLST